VAKIGMAMNRVWKSETGENKEEVTFVDVEAWGRQAEVIGQYLKKGRPLLVEGRLRLDTWEDKNTHQKVSKLKVVLESFSFLDSGGGRGDGGGGEGFKSRAAMPAAAGSAAPAAAESAPEEMGAASEDDVPF
jgi:single-strand DNA-binding protein